MTCRVTVFRAHAQIRKANNVGCRTLETVSIGFRSHVTRVEISEFCRKSEPTSINSIISRLLALHDQLSLLFPFSSSEYTSVTVVVPPHPLSLSLSIYLSIYLSPSIKISLPPSLSLYLSNSLSLSLSLSTSLSISLPLSLSLFPSLSLSLSLTFSPSLSIICCLNFMV
ncbi:unnamed protein product [Acanthosepion pharaonis]|uniref:Uncharacterized protein n=1 Tax=Acanthosepion pharaonis TaxID=158019 RepID=A0A812CUB6_ACAPH|nr:unnamed protein product [Sepia pharaonis]